MLTALAGVTGAGATPAPARRQPSSTGRHWFSKLTAVMALVTQSVMPQVSLLGGGFTTVPALPSVTNNRTVLRRRWRGGRVELVAASAPTGRTEWYVEFLNDSGAGRGICSLKALMAQGSGLEVQVPSCRPKF